MLLTLAYQKKKKLVALVVDEAHCVTHGYSFAMKFIIRSYSKYTCGAVTYLAVRLLSSTSTVGTKLSYGYHLPIPSLGMGGSDARLKP